MNLQVHNRYRRDEMLALFGSDAEPQEYYTPITVERSPDPQWVVLPDAVLCFATIGDHEWDCSFETPNWFAWATSQPQELQSNSEFWLLPQEVAGPHASRNIWLFGRLPGWKKYVCLGQIDQCLHTGCDNNIWGAEFEFSPPIPDDLWPVFRGSSFAGPADEGLDQTLDKVDAETSFDRRFAVLQRLAAAWYGPIIGDDAVSIDELGDIAMPRALREWYLWAGRRNAILSTYHQFFAPEHLRMVDGVLEFQMENQGAFCWGTSPDGDDPPVFIRNNDPGTPWREQGMTLIPFMIDTCLLGIKLTEGRLLRS